MPTTTLMQQALTSKQTIASVAPPKTSTSKCQQHRYHYSKHKKVKVSLADVLGTIAKNPLLLKKESDGKVSFTLATATIDKEAERSTKTTVQLSNIDAGAGGISLTANDKHSNDKHADNNLTNQSDNNPANQSDKTQPTNHKATST
ncbi:hypothetical protein BSPWISOXPB_563 [uncultured Gammaproteobacteria bacterium]|nr:hypothetical protein BSPWISOXPB_563 [uncultured Gammaproteobacteria bacterium]